MDIGHEREFEGSFEMHTCAVLTHTIGSFALPVTVFSVGVFVCSNVDSKNNKQRTKIDASVEVDCKMKY